MKVVLIGSGGREYALARSLQASPLLSRLIVCPGSDAISRFSECMKLSSDWSSAATEIGDLQPDLVIIGPEAPLVAGLANRLREKKIPVVGPGQECAQLEGSKSFAKEWMRKNHIPTAHSSNAATAFERSRFVDAWNFARPLVIKADGLAGGKGVFIVRTHEEALLALRELQNHANLVFEDFIEGHEVSLTVLVSDQSYAVCPPVQDHKRRFEHDRGPNTGGMGTVSPPRWWTPTIEAELERTIIRPSVNGLKEECRQGRIFRGILFIGVMIDAQGKGWVLEYNVRFGDPETQTLCRRLQGDCLPTLLALARGENLPSDFSRLFSSEAAATIVAVTKNYPEPSPKDEEPITGLTAEGQLVEEPKALALTHASTRWDGKCWLAKGGRVLGVGGTGQTLDLALEQAYSRLNKVHFSSISFRKDIGAFRGKS